MIHRPVHNGQKGFTLLEVSFVITIFAIMASIVLFRFKDFGAKTAFENLSQDIALRIVEAQKAGISGKLNPNFVSASAAPAYGVYFKTGSGSATTDPATHEFVYFTDIPVGGTIPPVGDKIYNVPAGGCPSAPAVGNECMSTTAITSGEYVSGVCYKAFDGTTPCDSASGTSANITFIRPFPDATIMMCMSSGTCTPALTVYIELLSALDPSLASTIVVKSLGEVRVFPGRACEVSGAGC